MTTRKIFWTSREKSLIAEKVLSYIDDGSRPYYVSLANKAQKEVIDESRQRKIVSVSQIRWIKAEINTLKIARDLKKGSDQIKIENTDLPIPASMDALIKSITKDQVLEPITAIIGPITKALDEIIANQRIMFQLLNSIIKDKVEPIPIKPLSRVKKPVVLIAGANSQQLDEISTYYVDKFDVRGLELDLNVKRITDMARGANIVVSLTNFISHSVDSALKGHKKYIRVSGGVSSVKKALDSELG